MKTQPKIKLSKRQQRVRNQVAPAKLTSLEYAIDGDKVVFRFNGKQEITIPSSVIKEINEKLSV